MHIRPAARAGRFARSWPPDQPRPYCEIYAAVRHPRSCRLAAANPNDEQSPRLSDRVQSACAQLHDDAAEPDLAGRHHLCRDQQGLVIRRGRSRSRQAQSCRLVHERDVAAEGAFEARRMAVDRQRSPPGPIHHSDRDIQYASEAYRRALATANITPSMSRKVDRQDNALLGSFFHTLKTERDHHRDYATRDEARQDLFRYIEGFYNSGRLNSALGNLSPAGYKRRAA